ncbi:MAG: DUF3536 domain-containing protein, partial [Deltaproteobacteria bacterium]|nr:DUF3536 domain-containing protein [Deltaproteobacteria bacterium]
MERYVCIHGHFYQPPRENAWLEAIELQDEAYPYHDWNERITAECYALNAASRIQDKENRIIKIVNNYAKMSFNFGPTLLAWLEKNASSVYRAVLEADQESQARFSGHGSALAQAYNHLIMPLASRRDKQTQIHWGLRDFEHRFGRKAEGMWLPETAVDLETLDLLAQAGLKFTILAPHQAQRVRALGESAWQDVSQGRIDTTRAFRINLASGRHLDLFFYNGSISQAVGFKNLLSDGETFALRLVQGFDENREEPQLVHVANDGETYGHHHRFGDMALAYALDYIETRGLARLTNYGHFLAQHPPGHEVEIEENTSWSCVHGVERWRVDCGCTAGGQPGWNQAWRKPLREALDWLREALVPIYEEQASRLLKDPWLARNDYIDLILDRSPASVERFLASHARRQLDQPEVTTALKLLEIERQAMLMQTSCGWFFNDIGRIEPVQILQHAGRALQLAQEVAGQDLSARFLDILQKAESNQPDLGDGRQIYLRRVQPAVVSLDKVGAHYAISSIFEEYDQQARIYCYLAQRQAGQLLEAGRAKLLLGRAQISSEVTLESAELTFVVLHFGDHNLSCGVRGFQGEEAYQLMVDELSQSFDRADFPETLRLLDKHFGLPAFSLKSLFRDEQRKILNLLLESTLNEAEDVYGRLYEQHAPLMRFLQNAGMPLPRALSAAAEVVLNAGLYRAF